MDQLGPGTKSRNHTFLRGRVLMGVCVYVHTRVRWWRGEEGEKVVISLERMISTLEHNIARSKDCSKNTERVSS